MGNIKGIRLDSVWAKPYHERLKCITYWSLFGIQHIACKSAGKTPLELFNPASSNHIRQATMNTDFELGIKIIATNLLQWLLPKYKKHYDGPTLVTSFYRKVHR